MNVGIECIVQYFGNFEEFLLVIRFKHGLDINRLKKGIFEKGKQSH